MHRPPETRSWRFGHFTLVAVIVLLSAVPTWLHAQTISGTVKEPTCVVIAGARIEITGTNLAQPLVLYSDGTGKFTTPELKPGTYTVRVMRESFEPLVQTVDLQASAQLQLTLTIAKQQESISVSEKSSAFANSDPVYHQLRAVGQGQTFRFDNFTLPWDAATFQFQKGTLSMLSAVNGIVTGAIFIGEGHFNLKPGIPLDARELNRRTGATEFNEDFTQAVFRFTVEAHLKFLHGLSC